jgi:hypothetical protein
MDWRQWIAIVVAVDLVITVALVIWIVRRKSAESGYDLGRLKSFADSTHAMIGEYVRANWNGRPDALPGVLNGLLDRLEAEAGRQGLALDRTLLRGHLARSVASHRIAEQRDLDEALRQIA